MRCLASFKYSHSSESPIESTDLAPSANLRSEGRSIIDLSPASNASSIFVGFGYQWLDPEGKAVWAFSFMLVSIAMFAYSGSGGLDGRVDSGSNYRGSNCRMM